MEHLQQLLSKAIAPKMKTREIYAVGLPLSTLYCINPYPGGKSGAAFKNIGALIFVNIGPYWGYILYRYYDKGLYE